MTSWIALLRGVNVGGKNILPMKELRALLEGLGMANVKTYIQSGNCFFQSDLATSEEMEALLEEKIETNFGFRPKVLVLKAEDLKTAIEANPFADSVEDPKNLHLFFLSSSVGEVDYDKMNSSSTSAEEYSLVDQVFYLHTPNGFHGSKVARVAEKCLGVAATGRNLRSAMKIAEMATT